MTSFTTNSVEEFMKVFNTKSNEFKNSKDDYRKVVVFKDLLQLLLSNKDYFIQINELTNYKMLDTVIESVKTSKRLLNDIEYNYFMKNLESFNKSEIKKEDNGTIINSQQIEDDNKLYVSSFIYLTAKMNYIKSSKNKQQKIEAFKSCLDHVINNADLFKKDLTSPSYTKLFNAVQTCLENNKGELPDDIYFYYKNKLNNIMNTNEEQKECKQEKEASKLNPTVSLQTQNIVNNIMEKNIQEKDIYIRKLQDEIAYRDGHIERLQEICCDQQNKLRNSKDVNRNRHNLIGKLQKENSELKSKVQTLETENKELCNENDELYEDIEKFEIDIYKLEDNVKKLELENESLKDSIISSYSKLQKLNSKNR